MQWNSMISVMFSCTVIQKSLHWVESIKHAFWNTLTITFCFEVFVKSLWKLWFLEEVFVLFSLTFTTSTLSLKETLIFSLTSHLFSKYLLLCQYFSLNLIKDNLKSVWKKPILLHIEPNTQPLNFLQLNSWCIPDTRLGSDKAMSLVIKCWIWHTRDKWEFLTESCSTFAFTVCEGGFISISLSGTWKQRALSLFNLNGLPS